MRKYSGIIVCFVSVLSLVLFGGCNKTDIGEGYGSLMGDSVELKLNLECAAMEIAVGGESTRSLDVTTDDNEFQIENLWVIQFDENGIVVGYPKYIADYKESSTVTLLNPKDATHELLYLANTYNPYFSINLKMEKADVLSISKLVEKMDDCVNSESGEVRVISSGMTKFTATDISGNTLPVCKLKSGLAKITLNIDRADEIGDDFEIKSVQMKNVCDKLYYYYSDTDRESNNYPLIDQFNAIDYPYIEENKESYTFYVPMNCRGSRDNAQDDPKLKPHYAQPYDTYANVHVTIYGSSRDYKFYLGGNLTDDFNLKPNNKYTYNITFNSAGEYKTDARIEDYSDYDYTQYPSSNCYILNPSATNSRVYTIPIVERVNEFWTTYIDNSANLLLGDDPEWSCELIWSDALSLQGSDGNNISFEKSDTNHKAMKVTLPQGMSEGNFVVGVKKPGVSGYLWSWHFWVTEYRPSDVAKTLLGNENLQTEYRYGVNGGEVHKYSSAGETVDGEICYIMDRSIGARSIDYNDTHKGVLLYQYGRKDPFPSTYNSPLINSEGVVVSASIEISNKMDYAVNNPFTFLTTYSASDVNTADWEKSKDSFKELDIAWNDKNVKLDTGGKSIFDPSPHGWRIPEINAFERASKTYGYLTKSTIGSNNTFYYNNTNIATSVSTSNYLAKFPVYGYIDGDTGEFVTSSTTVYYWLCYPTNVDDGDEHEGYANFAKLYDNYGPTVEASGFSTVSTEMKRASALPVRPVFYKDDFTLLSTDSNVDEQ